MEKFLSIPVLDGDGTNSQRQLVSITGLTSIGQPTDTTVSLEYLGGKTVTLTYASAFAAPILLESVQTAVTDALKTGWTNVTELHSPNGSIQSSVTGVFTNLLASIAIA